MPYKNPEQRRLYQQAWRKKHKKQHNEAIKKWRQENKEKVRQYYRAYRAAKKIQRDRDFHHVDDWLHRTKY